MKKFLFPIATLALTLSGIGCVSTQSFDQLRKQVANERDANNALKDHIAFLDQKREELSKDNARLSDQLSTAKSSSNIPKELDNHLAKLTSELRSGLGGFSSQQFIRTDHAVGIRLDDGGELLFLPGSWKVTKNAEKSLDTLADVLKDVLSKHADYLVRIDGHTDSDPVRAARKLGIEDNTHLSFMRAHAVMKYLVEHGLDEKRMFPMALGERCPISDTKKMNRRVEVWVSTREGFSLMGANEVPSVSR